MVADGTHESLWYGNYPDYEEALYAFFDRVSESPVPPGDAGE